MSPGLSDIPPVSSSCDAKMNFDNFSCEQKKKDSCHVYFIRTPSKYYQIAFFGLDNECS